VYRQPWRTMLPFSVNVACILLRRDSCKFNCDDGLPRVDGLTELLRVTVHGSFCTTNFDPLHNALPCAFDWLLQPVSIDSTASSHNNMRMYTLNQYSHVRGPLQECRSIRSGASGLPYYCAPLVCISAVIGLLAVWRHDKPKTKSQKPSA